MAKKVIVMNEDGTLAWVDYPPAVVPPAGTAPVFTASSPPTTGTVGQTISYQFACSGTTPPVTYRAPNALPPGLTLTSAGRLGGALSTAGSVTYSVIASNGIAPDATISRTMTVTAVVPPPAGAVLRDYSTGNFSQWHAREYKEGGSAADLARQQQIVTSPVRKGFKYSARFEVEAGDMTSGDPARNRSEVADYADVSKLFGGTSWWAWSMWVENFWVDTNGESRDGNGWVIGTQWHGVNDLPLVIGFSKPADHIPHLTVQTMNKGTSRSGNWDLGVLPQRQWVDLVAGVKWSNTSGHLTFKMNGVTKIDVDTPTLEAGANGIVYPKQGIYRARSERAQWILYTATRYGPTEGSVALPPQ